ncbi:MAG: hypothetical protein Q8M16_07215 [Pirellulaceae bacterium]|nr:hypothetical protein [Pirellulaceae bacterium]
MRNFPVPFSVPYLERFPYLEQMREQIREQMPVVIQLVLLEDR